ncbi:MAG: hypothetical protein EOO29_19515 [Comamonadaceae bacterium]|nr:MAG: hypothetical protein EOO29_19515 [Comamonadaceae bacterium]
MLALCFSGTLGQMHRVVHAPGLAALQATAQASSATPDQAGNAMLAHSHAHAHDDASHAHGHGWLNALFGAHTDAECRLYDQLSGDPALQGLPLVVLPLQLPTAQLLMRAGDFIARWVALFDARGPPRAFVFPR